MELPFGDTGLQDGEPPASLLQRRQRADCLSLSERPCAQIDADQLGRDLDVLAGGRVAPFRFLCLASTRNGERDQPANPTFWAFPSSSRSSAPSASLAFALARFGTVGDGGDQLVWVSGTEFLQNQVVGRTGEFKSFRDRCV